MRLNSLTTRILAGLLAGLALGALLPGWRLAWQGEILSAAEAIGGVWLDALRMTLIPLVFALLVVGVAQVAGTARAGGFTARILAAFGGLLLLSAAISALAVPALLQAWPAPADAARALRASALGAARTIPPSPPFAEFVRSFVPANPIKAASDGSMGSMVVFALVFGFAATRLAEHRRDALYRFFDAVQAAMMKIVEWVLWAGPVGVFFLALGVGAKTGFGAIGLLG